LATLPCLSLHHLAPLLLAWPTDRAGLHAASRREARSRDAQARGVYGVAPAYQCSQGSAWAAQRRA